MTNITSWGRYPVTEATIYHPKKLEDMYTLIKKGDIIPRGNGRSYGDSALAKNIVSTLGLRYFIDFNQQTGLLTCEAGALIADIINTFLPKGWFLPVTPGTKYITVGGAIASDVHGKNHHHLGCFSDHIVSMNILLPSGEVRKCSKTENSILFYATCGGMGLTGFILNATIKLLSVPNGKIKQTIVKAKNLEEIVELFNIHHDATYSVAWIDCLAKGPNFGRSLLMLGEHSDKEISLTTKKQISLAPLGLMGKMLNSKTMQLFNAYYYHCTRSIESFVDYDTFFYPLDHISNWNKMYGKKGFVQYQFVLPEKDSTKNMAAILKEIVNNGQGSFLAVLKRFGPANNNLLSFPMEGLTLALDFKMNSSILSFLDKLDRMVYQYDGRVYLTKDARLSEAAFSSMYKNLDAFREFRAKLGADRLFNSLQSTRLKL